MCARARASASACVSSVGLACVLSVGVVLLWASFFNCWVGLRRRRCGRRVVRPPLLWGISQQWTRSAFCFRPLPVCCSPTPRRCRGQEQLLQRSGKLVVLNLLGYNGDGDMHERSAHSLSHPRFTVLPLDTKPEGHRFRFLVQRFTPEKGSLLLL